MGVKGALSFKRTMKFLQHELYEDAADEALDSNWAKQTPQRAGRVADMIRSEAYA